LKSLKYVVNNHRKTGQCNTYVERLGVVAAHNGRTEAYHQFLKLIQPISRSSYPNPRILEAGETYEFPFTFNVPEHLLLGACRHKVTNSKLRDAHLELPPSLGNPESTNPGFKALDDMSPDMLRIMYGVRVRLLHSRDKDGKEVILADRYRKLHVIPAVEEQPPMTIDGRDVEFCLRKEKAIRKGMFKGKTGRLVMEAAQPRSFHLDPTSPTGPSSSSPSASSSPATTSITVLLRFDPTEAETQPPRLGSLSNKIRILTYYATSTMHDYPSKATILYDYTRGCHNDSISLSSRNMASVRWHRQDPDTCPNNLLLRRNSAASTTMISSCPNPTSTYSADKPFYVAEILVPITLPADKAFVPSFHSCLASRIYILDLSLSVPSQSGSGVGSTVTLKIPVQVSAEGSEDAVGLMSPISEADQLAAYEAEVQQAVQEGEGYFFGEGGRDSEAPPADEYEEDALFRTASVSTQGRSSISTQGRSSISTQGRGSMSTHRRPSFPLSNRHSFSAQARASLSSPPPFFSHRPSVSTVVSESSDLSLSTTRSPGTTTAGNNNNVDETDEGPPEYSFVNPRGSVPVCG